MLVNGILSARNKGKPGRDSPSLPDKLHRLTYLLKWSWGSKTNKFPMKLKGVVIGVKPDGKEIRFNIDRKIGKIPKNNDFSAFQIGAGVKIRYVRATVTDQGRLLYVFNTI